MSKSLVVHTVFQSICIGVNVFIAFDVGSGWLHTMAASFAGMSFGFAIVAIIDEVFDQPDTQRQIRS